MEKRLQKDKRQLSCMWGFHHFHRTSRNHKLLSNGRILHKNAKGKLQPRELGMLAKCDVKFYETHDRADSKALTAFAGDKKIENLIQKEKLSEKKKKNQIMASTEKHSKKDIGLFDCLIEKYKEERKASRNQLPVSHWDAAEKQGFQQAPTSVEVHKNKINLATILEVICNQLHPENKDAQRNFARADYDGSDVINIQLVQMSAKAFIDQLFIDRKYVNRSQASFTEFSDAFEMLNSNKDLFLKFLRDPNSLLAKHIQNLQHEEMEKETIKSFLNKKFSDHQSNETSKTKKNQHQFEQKLDGRSTDPQPSDRIVVLKPIPRRVHYSEKVARNCSYSESHQSSSNKRSNVKHKSFSLAEIKRKLKCAMREKWKEQQWISMHGTSRKLDCNKRTVKIGDKENIVVVNTRGPVSSTTYARMKNKSNKLQELGNEPEISCTTETVRKKLNLSKQQEFGIFLEAKRHLSQKLRNVNEDESLESSHTETLARILDSPERDFWATQSPKRYSHTGMRFSPLHYHRVAHKTCSQIWKGKEKVFFNSQWDNEEISSCSGFGRLDNEQEAFSSSSGTSEHQHGDSQVQNNIASFTKTYLKSNGHNYYVAETTEVKCPSDTQNLEPCTQIKTEDVTKLDPALFSQCSILDSPSKSLYLGSSLDVSSTSLLSVNKLDVSEDVKDKNEHPSPVSVLDLSFMEDIDSPTSLTEQPSEMLLQPRCINFEVYSEQDSALNPEIKDFYVDDKDTISSYVESALQAFYLNWEELWVNSPSPEQLLQASLFDELELPSLDMHCNPELLLDYVNEVLLETYQCYFVCHSWPSFPPPRVQSFPLEKDLLLDKVMKEVNHNLSPVPEQPTLDWLVAKDLAKSGSWLDIRTNSAVIVSQIADDILEELIMEILL